MRLWPVGTVQNGWRLLITRTPHRCAECGDNIRPRKGAWMREIAAEREYLCQTAHYYDRLGLQENGEPFVN